MNMTLITDAQGNILGTVQGHSEDHAAEGWIGTIVAGPGQQLHKVVVPTEVANLKNINELHRKVKTFLPQR